MVGVVVVVVGVVMAMVWGRRGGRGRRSRGVIGWRGVRIPQQALPV